MSASNIQVAIKVRPIDKKLTSKWEVAGNSIKLVDGGQPEPFYFDHIFDQDANNQVIFDTIAKEIVTAGVKGFNGTIFAYGQTSSGKTYTMMGDEENPGVMVLAAKKIFQEIENATDWQFLLRVSYIEIHNEKIHDLLNKSNTDLKIHEANGEVSVNCSEHIITCEQDLLIHVREGSKQRKIAETLMNERSSRSHAIFRIIIESRNIEHTDDSVQISTLNLVDLAGSERADQTGATGSRLKEGANINKSLLFLSRVIKQLAEASYVSYRDSKLTRILQASLGGNALTAIICTINPTAVEETLSTLSFANRAKVVKNKPKVNEVLSDTAMMKRLVQKIENLTNELEVEKSKNSQIKVCQLQKLLNDEIHKIINSNPLCSLKASSKNRRRTWCPSSLITPLVEEPLAKTETSILQSTTAYQMPTKIQLPKIKSGFNFTPHITVRDVYYQEQLKEIECSPNIDEEFIPGEDVCFDEVITPKASPTKLGFKTPTHSNLLRTSLTPKLTEKQNLQKVEQELKDLEAFTNLENTLNVEHDTYNTLKCKLEDAERIIANYKKERENFAFIKVEHLEAQTNLANCQKRCQELETKVRELEESSQISTHRIDRYEKEVTDLKDKINQLEMENRAAVGLEFEFEQHKNKSKCRETELLEAIEEKQKKINTLERSLQTITTDMLNNSKEEIQQISRSLNESELTCGNCKDLQKVLSGKEQLIQEFEKVNSDNKNLHLNIEKISAEAESAKLKADYLETENTSLKKDIQNFTSLHGTLEDVKNNIASLQSEKCKLESIKIEFEVMSKETAIKTAEKINISQEIETLNTQRDCLAAECDKLQSDIASTICTRDELDKIRSENESLHSELQKIKTKLETVQQEYANLMTENQSKSDSFEILNMEVLRAKNQLHTLQNEYHDIQQKYEQIQAECNKHEGTIGEIQSEYESIQTKYQCLQKEYEKLENDSVQSFADCDRVQAQNENLETEIRELKAKVEEAQRQLLENDSLQLELNSLKSEMNRLQGEYQRNLSNSICKEGENGCDLSTENAKLKEELNNLQMRFYEMQKEYDDTSTQLVDSIADYETLQNEMENLQAEFDRYKSSPIVHNSTDKSQAMKEERKDVNLEADDSQLDKKNPEWDSTTVSTTESTDETDLSVADSVKVKNESILNDSPKKSLDKSVAQFIQLADSFLEIEIALGSGGSRIFQAVESNKCINGTRMIIGNISEITQGRLNELRGAIEFAISNDMHKLNNDIFDSLEMEKNTASSTTNSCDSLEVPCRQSNEAHVNELIEEKSKLFENVRELQETVSALRSGTVELASTRQELKETQLIVNLLKCEKSKLSVICEENKCKISELVEIISRTESENMKLIADCEELKQTVESDCTIENVSRESYEELRRQHEELYEKMIVSENKDCVNCSKLREQIQTMQLKSKDETNEENCDVNNSTHFNAPGCISCEEHLSKIAKLEAIIKEADTMKQQPNGNHNNSQVCDEEKISEYSETNGQLHKNSSLTADDQAAKHEREIYDLVEELKMEKSKYQEIQNDIADLQKNFEDKNQESAKYAEQLEGLNSKFEKLQIDYDELLSFERMKSTELEESALQIEKLHKQCNQLRETVSGLKETITLLEDERNNTLKNHNDELNEKLKILKESNIVALDEKKMALEKSLELDQEKEKIFEECQSLKNSEIKLQEEIQKLIEDHKVAIENKNRLQQESEQNTKENLKKLNDELMSVSAEKQLLQNDLEKRKEELENLKESHLAERQILQEKCNSLSREIDELTNNKKEIESALEKAQDKSNENEERWNLEMCKVRNSNCFMTQQIESLTEKLEDTENKLRVAIEKSNTEKEQLIIDLTNSNKSLLEKSGELETACSLLRQELKETKESLLSEINLKQDLENDLKSKEELISNTSKSLVAKSCELEAACTLLRRELEEAKESLLSEVSLKQSLEEECRDKEELLSQISNTNDSLKTKSCDLDAVCTLLRKELEEARESLLSEASLKLGLEDECRSKEELLSQISDTNKSLAAKSSELETACTLLRKELEELKKSLLSEVSLKQSLENECKSKEELISQISNTNKSITAKKSELETTCTLLTQELEKAKESLLSEVSLKQSLENEYKSKEELLSQISNTKNSLAAKCTELESKGIVLEQQIAETKQCLIDKKHRLEDLQEDCLKKDEQITQLSNKNETLATNSADLEGKIALLEQRFEESKLYFSNDVRIKDEESSKKDDLITELSNKNKSLTTKSSELEEKLSLLEKQFDESNRCLATEKHLKEVLEKANTERDDLIVQLTNNNNSLVTKSSELEAKLAILANQFEESKRHLSSEVSRLNKTLVETNTTSHAQSSKIEDLMQKIESLESDLRTAKKTATERDSLLQKIDGLQKEYDTLALKNANLELNRTSFEAELNSARAVVIENTALIKQINELKGSFKEIQLKCDTLSSSNADLVNTNNRLTQQLKDAIKQAEECNQLRNEIIMLRENVKKEENLKNKSNSELQNNLKEWESKERLFSNQIVKLQSNVTALVMEKTNIQKEFDAAVKSNSEKVNNLEKQIQSLQKDLSINLSKSSISPKKEKNMEYWMSENHQLKVKNMSLREKLDSCQKSTPNEERRNRRLSTHDERRLQSFWDSNRDVSTMTDPTNAECSCSEMNLKLTELKQKLLIRDSQVNTLSMEIKNHPLKQENATLKKLIVEEESKQQQLRHDVKKYKNLLQSKTNESKHCAKCFELSKKFFVDDFTQTNDSDESECYRKIQSKYEDLKMICRSRHTKIRELELLLSKGKENASSDNISSLSNQQYREKYEQLKKELSIVQEKYEKAKILCNMRYEQIKKLSNSNSNS